ncbi:rhomboid family intramembrane serine protease [Thermodesulfobacteriota bacterium]
MKAISQELTSEQADSFSLVLSSQGISHQIVQYGRKWVIFVEDTHYDAAESTIAQYLEENENYSGAAEYLGVRYQKTFSGLWAACILMIVHVRIATEQDAALIIKEYGASAYHILGGELYRVVTSLMLHADMLHLGSNMVGIALFGTAVCAITGWGIGWLLLLISGALGNTFNAIAYQTGHLSIGASTTVFGGIGILCAYQFMRKINFPGKKLKAFIPIGAGLALLGFLGSAKHSDLLAHLFGFVAGIFLGIVYAYFIKTPPDQRYQTGAFVIFLLLIILSWTKSLVFG